MEGTLRTATRRPSLFSGSVQNGGGGVAGYSSRPLGSVLLQQRYGVSCSLLWSLLGEGAPWPSARLSRRDSCSQSGCDDLPKIKDVVHAAAAR